MVLFPTPYTVASIGGASLCLWGPAGETLWALWLFSIVLQSILKSLAEDAQCNSLDFNCWYIDDEVLSGDTAALVRAVHIYGTTEGLLLNSSKCQLFGPCDPTRFYCFIPNQLALNFDILGAPIDDEDFVPLSLRIVVFQPANFCHCFHSFVTLSCL